MVSKIKRIRRTGHVLARRRKKALIRDDYTCQHCSRQLPPSDLEVHHKRPINQGTNHPHRLTNLITLCPECHSKEHKQEPNS